MLKSIYFILFLIMLIALIANPAPVNIEISDVVLIVLPVILCFFTLQNTEKYSITYVETDLLIAIMLYLTYLLFSMLLGILNGVSLVGVLRAIGPYINFMPIISIAFLTNKNFEILYTGIILIMIGFFQAVYLLFLYFSHSIHVTNTLGVLINRITLLDPHTTLPFILSLITLPMAWVSYKVKWIQWFAMILIIFGFIASAATLTRSLMIAGTIGSLIFILLYAKQSANLLRIHYAHQLLNMTCHLLYFIPIFFLILMIPSIHNLEQGLIARFLNHSISGNHDYSNGRLFDEWLPALSNWINSGVVGWFFGIGAGKAFNVISGEERTYIHNLSIYSLVYGGFFGFISCLWLYVSIFKTLIIRAFQTKQTIYLGFAALLISMFIYGQFFAVHKELAFNAMLFMIIAIALIQPAIKKGI